MTRILYTKNTRIRVLYNTRIVFCTSIVDNTRIRVLLSPSSKIRGLEVIEQIYCTVGWNLLLHNNNVNLFFTDQTKGPSLKHSTYIHV